MLLKNLENLFDTVNIIEGNFNRWTHLSRKINLQGEMKFKRDSEIHQVDRRTPVPKSAKFTTLSKKTSIHKFSCKFCWILQNNFFTEHLRNSGYIRLTYYMRIWRQIADTKNTFGLTLYSLVSTKRSNRLKQTCRCLSIMTFLWTPVVRGLTNKE